MKISHYNHSPSDLKQVLSGCESGVLPLCYSSVPIYFAEPFHVIALFLLYFAWDKKEM
jgi:hypothetical protein